MSGEKAGETFDPCRTPGRGRAIATDRPERTTTPRSPTSKGCYSMEALLTSVAVAFGVVFVAELGDKSQLMAMLFASRYRAVPVLAGIGLATVLIHTISVALGHGLGVALPTTWIRLGAGIAFLGFAIWTALGDQHEDSDEGSAPRSTRPAVITIAGAFLLAELGDKTMLATVTLAAQHPWLGIWIGSTTGMLVANALAIVVGRHLTRRLPQVVLHYGVAAMFAVIGLVMLIDGATRL
ncbi:MAG TPA: TMEM165/GDT1 family protein [Actinopolymorphaceae bacterium]